MEEKSSINNSLSGTEQGVDLMEKVRKLSEENSRLRDEFSVKIQRLSSLNRVARALNSVLKQEIIFKLIVSMATRELGARSGSLMLLEGEYLKIKAAFGLSEKVVKSTSVKVGEGVSGKVLASGRPLLVTNEAELEELTTNGNGQYKDYTFISVPITIDRENRGVININNKATKVPFNSEDLDFLENLANHAAISIKNASLFQRAQRLAFTDGLTGLFNHRFFQERILEEVARSKRYGKTKIVLLMIDIDDFKHINDTYGHPLGDQVLKKIATIMLKGSRVTDIVSRYGGEEFSIILTETEQEGTVTYTERLLQRVAEYDFSSDKVKVPERITLSIGVSHYPGDADSPAQLIERADQALYKAKRSGKNRVCFHRG